jgi:type I restriction enzyme, S subunit
MSSTVPDGWSYRCVDEFASVYAGGTPSRSKPEYFVGSNPWVKSGEVNARQIFSTEEHISDVAIEESSAKWAKAGSVLVAMYGATAGQVAELMVDATLNQAVAAVNAEISVATNSYLLHSIHSNTPRLLNTLQGSGQPNLSGQLIKELVILLPPLPEQEKIASILTSVDEVIERTESQIAKLQDLKTGMMQELLTKGIGHTKFKDSPVGRIPVGWNITKLSTVVDVIDSLHQTPSFSLTGYPMARVTDINTGKLNLSKANHVSRTVYEEFIKKYRPMRDDILMSRVGSYGICSYVDTDEEFCIGQNTVVISALNINSRFLYYSLNSQSIQTQIEYEVAGSGYKSLSLASIRCLDMVIPSTNEQERIGSICLGMDNAIEKKLQKTLQLQRIKKALMRDLLTGKVRVKTD